MPERIVHKKISKLLLGSSCERTHKAIDYPVKYLGKKHRILFHDPISAMVIGFLFDGYEGAASGLLHIVADRYGGILNYLNKL